MQGNNITAPKQFFQRYILDPTVLCREEIIGDHIHAKAPADIDKDPADLAGADHTNGLAVKVKSRQSIQGEVEISRADICLMNTTD